MQSLTLTRPDDWHIHLRDGEALKQTVEDASKQFARAIVMPNLIKPIQSLKEADAYFKRIMAHVPLGRHFQPLMTLYLTEKTTPDIIREAAASGRIYGMKLYPAGATTNSALGITCLDQLYPLFESMEEVGMPLLVHGEITDTNVDIFDREKFFLNQYLAPWIARFKNLKMVLEHITTRDAVSLVLDSGENVAATVTAHHLWFNRNDLLVGGIRPHFYCLPVLKRKRHQEALIQAVTCGHKQFFLGTDSAPHSQISKESACGCAGCYTAICAIEMYAQVFDDHGALDKLEAFTSFNGPDFYGLARNHEKMTLIKEQWCVPNTVPLGNEKLIPLCAGQYMEWKIATIE